MCRSTVILGVVLKLLFLALFVNNEVRAVSVDDYDEEYWEEMQKLTEDPEYGVSWTFMPDGYGIPRVAHLTEPQGSRMAIGKGNVNFYLYTKGGSREGKDLDSIQAVNEEFHSFDPRKWTVFLVHGWQASESIGGIYSLRESYLLADQDVNLITVDWQDIAANWYYFECARQTNNVGRTIAELIDYMVANMSLSLDRTHLIGHSLGAHTAGYAGSYVTSGRIARITGLDPAGPAFYTKGPEHRLDPSDAEFVDVIHTAVGSAGHYKDLGHVDFFPNGGIYQPGCGDTIILKEACSHSRAQEYYAESILMDSFYSYKCKSMRDLQSGDCDTEEFEMMGEYVSLEAEGRYYLEVGKESPYHMGKKEQSDRRC